MGLRSSLRIARALGDHLAPSRLALDPLPLCLGLAQKLDFVDSDSAKPLGAATATHSLAICRQGILPNVEG